MSSPPNLYILVVPMKTACMQSKKQLFSIYIFFIFGSMYMVLFSIVLYRTIVTVYTDNIFLYNYQWQMHQIIHLLQEGCFTPARGKTVQKNCEVSRVTHHTALSQSNINRTPLTRIISHPDTCPTIYKKKLVTTHNPSVPVYHPSFHHSQPHAFIHIIFLEPAVTHR